MTPEISVLENNNANSVRFTFIRAMVTYQDSSGTFYKLSAGCVLNPMDHRVLEATAPDSASWRKSF